MCPTVSFPSTMHFSSCFIWSILARSGFVMTALCLHYAIRPSFIHPSSLSPPPSLLALLLVACFCVRISLCMGLGGANSLGMFRVCRFCESASPRVHWHRSDCAAAHPHTRSAAGAEVRSDSGSHGDFGRVLVGAC